MVPPLDVTLRVVSWIVLYGLVTFLCGHTVPRDTQLARTRLCRVPSAESKCLHATDLHLPKKSLFTQKHPGHREAPASHPAPLPAAGARRDLRRSSFTWVPKPQINVFLQVLGAGEGRSSSFKCRF